MIVPAADAYPRSPVAYASKRDYWPAAGTRTRPPAGEHAAARPDAQRLQQKFEDAAARRSSSGTRRPSSGLQAHVHA
jgi:hypothetical protein